MFLYVRHDDPEIFERKVNRVIHSKQLRQLCAMISDYTFYFKGKSGLILYLYCAYWCTRKTTMH